MELPIEKMYRWLTNKYVFSIHSSTYHRRILENRLDEQVLECDFGEIV
jgi:hypothetical protein